MSNQRVYIVISSFHPLVGGAERQALAQGKMLQERGYDVTVVTFHHRSEWPVRDVIEGVPVLRVAGSLMRDRLDRPRKIQQIAYLLAQVALGWDLWRHRRKYDILHVYQLSLLALPTALVSRLAGKPILISVRSTGTGKSNGTDKETSLLAGPLDPSLPWLRIEANSWVNGDLEALLRLGKPVANFVRSLLTSERARIIILSTRMRSYLAENGFLLPNVQLIPNGVDIVHYQPPQDDEASFQEKAHTVVCLSRLRYEKGIDVLLQAWKLVKEQVPDAKLIVIGSGKLLDQLTNMAEALGITDSVEFAGRQYDIPEQLHRGTIAVLPSRWEGMPNAVLEAMACGLPCVATRVSGSEDIIQQGKNGLLVDSEDYQAMAQALITLLKDADLTRKYGKAARAHIEEHYSLEHITDSYIELYGNLTGQKEQQARNIPPSEIYQIPS
ncbi:glycosyltransferase family 1 protein [Ktedonosporobacter rubrisoli]|uniref:Glycosyltransferase family 1 protein n=1 Tax=Ktedonosporobacter rubrisoli TaxID=2509675 RepID=A0A4P6JT14_KTERU|nr:glycosyltransferase family 4 protein [Ktedonosporobacter rubrisoli]QBD78392.1 glycosyltransferase family 1 protein [Ktedonosporobacter rubrisoli]